MVNVLLVGVGGAAGCIARYGLTGLSQRLFGAAFPVGTLAANVIGCLVIGFLGYLVTDRPVLTPQHRLLLMTGFLGGLTTFSSFGYETMELARKGDWSHAGLNVGLNVVLSLGAVWAGLVLARTFVK